MAFDMSDDDDSSDFGGPVAPVLYLQDKASDFAGSIEDDNWESHATDRLADALDSLDERSQDIIRARWLTMTTKQRCKNLLINTAFLQNAFVSLKERHEEVTFGDGRRRRQRNVIYYWLIRLLTKIICIYCLLRGG